MGTNLYYEIQYTSGKTRTLYIQPNQDHLDELIIWLENSPSHKKDLKRVKLYFNSKLKKSYTSYDILNASNYLDIYDKAITIKQRQENVNKILEMYKNENKDNDNDNEELS